MPWIKASERSYASVLNVQGMQVYEKWAEMMWRAGIRDKAQYEGLAKVINHARGYGDFNPGQIIPGVNAFFSGRNLVSRFQVLLDPLTQPGNLFKPSPRRLAAQNLASFVGANMALMGFLG